MTYTLKEAAKKTDLPYHTLKFYCDEGLVPNVRRDQNNYRVFTEDNIEWIKTLQCLKNCGMKITEMKRYVELCRQGPETIPERQAILGTKLQNLQTEIACIQEHIDFIKHKQQLYQDILDGKTEYRSVLAKTAENSVEANN